MFDGQFAGVRPGARTVQPHKTADVPEPLEMPPRPLDLCEQEMSEQHNLLIKLCKAKLELPEATRFLVTYNFAREAHRGQKRDGGADYFDHLTGTAMILLQELQCADCNLLCAAMLHDVVENSPAFQALITDSADPYDKVRKCLSALCGSEVTELVLSVTKLPKDGLPREERLQNHVDTLWGASMKSVLLKCADRLDNLRTLDAKSEEDRRRIIRETREQFIPVFENAANRRSSPWSAHVATLLEKIRGEVDRLEAADSPVA